MSARLRLRRSDGQVYLDRWGLEWNRVGGIFIHKMSAPDPGIDLHDHPWWFTSLTLKGGYDEERCGTAVASPFALIQDRRGRDFRGSVRRRAPLSFQSTPLHKAHRIIRLHQVTSWSLVIHGPKRREWGFYTPNGWIHWRTYDIGRRDMWAEISNDADDRRQAREMAS